jgi:hypothetical protein
MQANIKKQINDYVLTQYIETGNHLFVSDIAEKFQTNGLGVRNALGYDNFVFEQADRWSGSSYAGRYIQAVCVEPTKSYLVQIIRNKHN